MTKYLLKAWEMALDKKICEECDKHKNANDPETKYRNVWYHICIWFNKEIENGDMIEEFEPFALSFCEKHILSRLKMYKKYRLPKEETEK